MSKRSPRQNYSQLMEWLETRKQKTVRRNGSNRPSNVARFSKADTYNRNR